MILLRLSLFFLIYLYQVNLQNQKAEWTEQTCPYNSLCTRKAPIPETVSVPDGFVSCCPVCKCDDKCYQFSDCCPDAPAISDSKRIPKVTCKKAIYKSRSVDQDLRANKYLMVQNCSYNDNSSNVQKCAEEFAETPTPDDIAVVADKNNPSRIFANKYCALCNGVKETKRWQLRARICGTPTFSMDLSMSKTRNILMENCIIESFPHPTEAHLIPFCPVSSDCVQTKTDSELSIAAACEKSFAPTFIQTSMGISRLTVYKNIFCFLCSKPEATPGSQICSKKIIEDSFRLSSLVMFLHLKDNVITKRFDEDFLDVYSENCGKYRLYDYVLNECRNLHCVGFAALSQGKCVSFANIASGAAFGVSISFIPISPTHVNLTNLHVNQTNVGTFETMFAERLEMSDCLFYIELIESYRKRSALTDVYFNVIFVTVITDKCTFEYLLQQLGKSIASKWQQELQLGDYIFQTIGSVNFYFHKDRMPSNSYDPDAVSRIIFQQQLSSKLSSLTIPIRFYAEMFLCPHFILNVSEYEGYVERVFPEHDIIQNETLTITTDLQDGFYLLPENKIAVCVDTYFSFANNANSSLRVFIFIKIAMSLFCCLAPR